MSPAPTKLVVGLGNPGPQYAATRHNVGFRVVEALGAKLGAGPETARFGGHFAVARLGEHEVALLRPQTFMNRSGAAVSEASSGLDLPDPAADLVVVYDDLDLPFGRLRARASGGAGGHRGLRDIIECLGTRDFPRLRFGIGRPPVGEDPVEYVLAPFSQEEGRALPDAIDDAVACLEVMLVRGITEAMNRFNRDPESTANAE